MSKEVRMEKTSLPDGWKMKKLIDLGEIQTGTTPSTNNKGFYGDFIPFVKPPHFNPDGTISFGTSGLSEIGLAKGRLIKANSILMVCIGASIGKTGIALIPISCNQQINAFTPNKNCLPKFYYHLLSSNYFFKKVMKRSSQATLPMINKTKWQNIEVPLPPLPEQKQIVALLDQAFAAIDVAKANAQQNLENAKKLFESYLQNVFSTKGEDWEEVALGQLCKLTRGHNPPKSKFIHEPREKYVRFYQIRDGWSDKHKVFVPDSPQLHKVEPKDMLMVAYRHIGRVFRGVEGAFNVALCKITNTNREKLDDDFLFYMIPTDIIKGELMKRSERSLIPSMSVNHLKEIIIPLPPIETQKQIVKKLDTLSKQTKKLEAIYTQKIADLEEMKKSVLQKAFRGELTVNKAVHTI